MARIAGSAGGYYGSPHNELLDAEEERFAQRGGRRVLIRDHMVRQHNPGRLLKRLRAGQPVEVMDWQLPRRFRPGAVRNARVRVHPSGLVEEV